MRFGFALIVVLGLLGSSAEASVLGNIIAQEEGVSTLNDNSRAVIFDVNENDLLDVGDEIVGILQFEKVNDVDPSPAGLFSVFALKLTGQRPFGTWGTILEYGAIDAGEAHSLHSLLDPAIRPSANDFNDWNHAAFALVEVDSLIVDDPKNPFSPTNSEAGDNPLAIITSVLSAANGYSLDAILGFDESNNDFFDTVLNPFAPMRIGDGESPLLISEIRADNSGIEVLSETAGLSMLYHALGNVSLMSLGIKRPGPVSTPVTYHDVILSPDGSVQTSTAGVPNWDLEDDTNFMIHVVPEPGTTALLISMAAALAAAGGRRRKTGP